MTEVLGGDLTHAAILAGTNGLVAAAVAKLRKRKMLKAALLQGGASFLAEVEFVRQYIDKLSEAIFSKVAASSYIDSSSANGSAQLKSAWDSLVATKAVGDLADASTQVINSYVMQRRVVHAMSTGMIYALMQELAGLFKVKAVAAEGETAKKGKSIGQRIKRILLNVALSGANEFAAGVAYDFAYPPLVRIKAMDKFEPNHW